MEVLDEPLHTVSTLQMEVLAEPLHTVSTLQMEVLDEPLHTVLTLQMEMLDEPITSLEGDWESDVVFEDPQKTEEGFDDVNSNLSASFIQLSHHIIIQILIVDMTQVRFYFQSKNKDRNISFIRLR
jgi:23S rRNA U2552 (ribose-2'-O)-methylase RlmE/FtsJ